MPELPRGTLLHCGDAAPCLAAAVQGLDAGGRALLPELAVGILLETYPCQELLVVDGAQARLVQVGEDLPEHGVGHLTHGDLHLVPHHRREAPRVDEPGALGVVVHEGLGPLHAAAPEARSPDAHPGPLHGLVELPLQPLVGRGLRRQRLLLEESEAGTRPHGLLLHVLRSPNTAARPQHGLQLAQVHLVMAAGRDALDQLAAVRQGERQPGLGADLLEAVRIQDLLLGGVVPGVLDEVTGTDVPLLQHGVDGLHHLLQRHGRPRTGGRNPHAEEVHQRVLPGLQLLAGLPHVELHGALRDLQDQPALACLKVLDIGEGHACAGLLAGASGVGAQEELYPVGAENRMARLQAAAPSDAHGALHDPPAPPGGGRVRRGWSRVLLGSGLERDRRRRLRVLVDGCPRTRLGVTHHGCLRTRLHRVPRERLLPRSTPGLGLCEGVFARSLENQSSVGELYEDAALITHLHP
mmetsp:Transcript_20764/g.65713  ORF Transcript_20764/g.65713 Transcript_20764/m.65713 type:complete len:467 (+) Transcript_20764:2359-3759(+)